MSDYNNGDTIDIRGVMARVEELEGERDGWETDCPLCTPETADDCEECGSAGLVPGTTVSLTAWQDECPDDATELAQLTDLLSELAGYGGDEQWRGDWYPVTLVADHYFRRHAEELADDCGMVPANVGWPMTCIDWAQAARELQQDYSSVTFDGGDWWYR